MASRRASTTSGCAAGWPSRRRGCSRTGRRSAPLRLAHRGDWRGAPENSLQALVAATRIPGCDGVEFDVRLSRDGVPVLLHDETLRRVQRRAERVDALDAATLAEAGGYAPRAMQLPVELIIGDSAPLASSRVAPVG